jgi:hypothetical protein
LVDVNHPVLLGVYLLQPDPPERAAQHCAVRQTVGAAGWQSTTGEGIQVPRRLRTPASASYTWIFDLLFAGGPAVAWAPAGELPDGFRQVEQFAILPAIAGRGFAVSLAGRRSAASALTSYKALRTVPRRLVREIFGLGLRAGLAQPFIRTRIDIGVAAGTPVGELEDQIITAFLARKLGCGQVRIAFGGGSGPYRKPVLQVFSPRGVPLAYVKIGWNAWTSKAVRQEAAALRACAARPMRLGVPGLIGLASWRGLDLLITAPMPGSVTRRGLGAPAPGAAVLREISELGGAHRAELAVSPWWQSLQARIGTASGPARAPLEQAASAIEHRFGEQELEFGGWHGDFVPWNMAQLGGQVYAWDWESYADQAPVGFDALHYYFQVDFVHRRRPLAQAAAAAARRAAPDLAALGVSAAAAAAVPVLHLMELFVRHEEARASAGSADDRFYPEVADVLAAALTDPGAASVPAGGRGQAA